MLSATNNSLNERITDILKTNQFKSEELHRKMIKLQKETETVRNERDSMQKMNVCLRKENVSLKVNVYKIHTFLYSYTCTQKNREK